jgi:pre-rRNA-processing protein TSR3
MLWNGKSRDISPFCDDIMPMENKDPQIFFIYLYQDDPKKSTMKKLERFNLARRIDRGKASRSMVLTVSSSQYLMSSDRNLILERGITAIEGSWKQNDLMAGTKFRYGRILPPLLASNPVNYGKWNLLSSVEAVSAALIITGFRELAEQIISKFSWGHSFISLNMEILEEYAKCKSEEDIRKVIDSIA